MSKTFYTYASVRPIKKGSIRGYEKYVERRKESYNKETILSEFSYRNIRYKSCNTSYLKKLESMIANGTLSTHGLKKDAVFFNEIVFGVNPEYFEANGGYDFAKRFYHATYLYASWKMGEQFILSAIMHADQINPYLTKKYSHYVFNYHLHVIAIPVVKKDILYTQNNKNESLIGTVKETVNQISNSKKWGFRLIPDGNGEMHLKSTYSILQTEYYNWMYTAGFRGFQRGKIRKCNNINTPDFDRQKELERINFRKSAVEKKEEMNFESQNDCIKSVDELILNAQVRSQLYSRRKHRLDFRKNRNRNQESHY